MTHILVVFTYYELLSKFNSYIRNTHTCTKTPKHTYVSLIYHVAYNFIDAIYIITYIAKPLQFW